MERKLHDHVAYANITKKKVWKKEIGNIRRVSIVRYTFFQFSILKQNPGYIAQFDFDAFVLQQ